jgi:hypothetical protein
VEDVGAVAAEVAVAAVVVVAATDTMNVAPRLFPNCNKMVVHAAADCFMLPANKDKISSWYKPPKTD